MATTLQARIQSLGQKLEEENESRRKEYPGKEKDKRSGRPKPPPDLRINPASRKPRPGKLSFDLNAPPISPRRRQAAPAIQLPASTCEDDSSQIESKLQEITKQTGFLKVGDEKIKFAIDDLETIDEIGSGTCGQVSKMRHKQAGAIFAVKRMRRSYNKEEQKRILMDLEVVMKSHDCPYIVNCTGSYISKSDVFICMELMSTCLDKLLKKLCGPIPENILGKMTVAIVKALNYLKETHGIMHRDVKPSNILLDGSGCVKLCDFGISGRLVDSKARTRSAGCAAYMAPERIAPPDPMHPDYDVRADVWSLGISLVELATGEFPYKNCSSEFEVLSSVMSEAPPSLPNDKQFSEEFRDFVNICLTKDYKERPKYNKLLEHSFIKRYEDELVDVGGWLSEVLGNPSAIRPAGLLETEL